MVSADGCDSNMVTRANILVIDDKPDNLRLLSNILIVEGYKVRKVLNGRLAIDAAQLDPPDLILLDIMMPAPDGYEVCQTLKENPKTQDIPIIFLSALDTLADKVKALSVGGVDFITKPFQQEEVLARVKTHLQIRRLNQSLQNQNYQLEQEIKQRQQIEAELQKTLQELQATQAQIVVKEKLASLGALMAGIAHELRNPLNFVNNYAEGSVELLEEMVERLESSDQFTPELLTFLQEMLEEVRGNAVAIHQHGQRAERIIRNMMQHCQSSRKDWQPFDLNSLLAEAIDLAYHSRRAQSTDFNVTMQCHYDETLQPLEGSPSDLSRAFINLIDNAFYAVYKQHQRRDHNFIPMLWVETSQKEGYAEIRIRDNGTGINPADRAKIFDPFFTTKANEGTGLGLSITHDILVEQHHGTLAVESQLNDFTEFTITLPA